MPEDVIIQLARSEEGEPAGLMIGAGLADIDGVLTATGGGGGITEITSTDGSLDVTDPTGPTTDLALSFPLSSPGDMEFRPTGVDSNALLLQNTNAAENFLIVSSSNSGSPTSIYAYGPNDESVGLVLRTRGSGEVDMQGKARVSAEGDDNGDLTVEGLLIVGTQANIEFLVVGPGNLNMASDIVMNHNAITFVEEITSDADVHVQTGGVGSDALTIHRNAGTDGLTVDAFQDGQTHVDASGPSADIDLYLQAKGTGLVVLQGELRPNDGINMNGGDLSDGSGTISVLNPFSEVVSADELRPSNFGAPQTSSVFAGTGTPSNANGSDGDFFLQSDAATAGTAFWIKLAGAWTNV